VDRDIARQFIIQQTETIEYAIRAMYPSSEETIQLWTADVQATCDFADKIALEALLEEIENISLLSSNTDVGVCLVIICISISDNKIGIGGNIFFANVKLSVDFKNKDVTFGAGPSLGGFGSARLDISSSGAVNVTTTAKMPIGPYVSHSTNVAQLW
jgi:hypothetical protein